MKRLYIVLMLTLGSCATISPQEVGLKVSKAGSDRGVSNTSIVNGYVAYNPFTASIVQYPRTVQGVTWKEGEEISFRSNGGLRVTAPVAFNFRVDPTKASDIYVKYGADLENTLMRNLRQIIQDNLNRVGSQYTPNELVGAGSVAFEDRAETLIRNDFAKIGFILENFTLPEGVHPPEAISKAIVETQQAAQNAIRVQNELATTKAQVQKDVEAARGQAQSDILRAEGQAKANRTLAQSLTPELVEYLKVQKWDGKNPSTVVGTDSSTLVNVR